MKVQLIDKATGAVREVATDAVGLDAPSVVRLHIEKADIAAIERQGDDLVVRLTNGETIHIARFHADLPGGTSDLVVEQADRTQWLARSDGGLARFRLIEDLDALGVAAAPQSALLSPALLGGLGGAAALGGALAAAGGGGGGSGGAGTGAGTPPGGDTGGTGGGTMPPGSVGDMQPPAPPSITFAADGTRVTGNGEAGASVEVRGIAGELLGRGTVSADGSFSVSLSAPQRDGQAIVATQTDAAGNQSAPTTVIAPDLTAPGAPDAALAPGGIAVTGTGEAGATVVVRGADGSVLGTAVVAADGRFAVTLATAQANGGTLTVVQTDAAGNASAPAALAVPDTTAPAAPQAALAQGGTIVTGAGEAGATIVVRGTDGGVLGSATAAADGSFAVPLAAPQANGGTLTVVQTDAAGNASAPTTLAVPDVTAPGAPQATLAPGGGEVTGSGEAGATIVVRGADGGVLGSGIVAADGRFSITLASPQVNGGTLTIVQTDTAGNASAPVTLSVPDTTAPAAPTGAVTDAGSVAAGTGEPGATVTVTGADGGTLATATVGADGRWSAPLATPQRDGETLGIVQTDAAGNASPAILVTAPDLTPAPAPAAAIDATGRTVSGTAEAGATVTVRDAAGAALGSAVANARGDYTVVLAVPQVDRQPLAVTQRDAAGNVSPATGVTAPDLTPPPAPAATVTGDGDAVTGIGEPGARVTVTDPVGLVLGSAVVAADGQYAVPLVPPQRDGEALRVVQADVAGNVSPATGVVAPDLVATPRPDAPTATIAPDGAAVSGSALAGAAITVRDDAGQVLATGTADAGGGYAVALSPAQRDGETLYVTQTGAAGTSPPATVIAPDLTAPAAPIAAIDDAGAVVTGTGEPGARVTVTRTDGTALGDAIVSAQGDFAVVLAAPQIDGGSLRVVQVDAAGNASAATPLATPDLVAPAAPVATITADGAGVTGTGEAGARVSVSDAGGAVLGSGTVGADGRFSVALTPPQGDGQVLTVTQADGAGNVSPAVRATAPDLTAPAAPTILIAADGAVATGTGEPGATLVVSGRDGAELGRALVGADGRYSVALSPAQRDGQVLAATQADAAGNVSAPATTIAPDTTPPAAPTATIAADGAVVSGTGEAGANVLVTDAAGTPLGSATVGADGRYAATLSTPQVNGEQLGVVQVDGAGQASPRAALVAPDLTPPAAPNGSVSGDGTLVTGQGEPGATVTVRAADGTSLGSATVAADGGFTVPLSPAQTNGEALRLSQADATGNASAALTVVAPDLTAPALPVATISAAGDTVTGSGEPGARVTVTAADGTVLGRTFVAADGGFTVALVPPQANGGAVGVIQADAAGNASPSLTLAAPDITAPAAPTIVVASDGTSVTGTGEPGARVTVTGADPAVPLAVATVGSDGRYAAALSPAQANGETLTAVQVDGAGNRSAPVTVAAPDVTAPAAPVAAISVDGAVVTGTGEPGSLVTIRDAANTVVGTAVVGADGRYAATLRAPETDGETLSVTARDAAGNVSAATTILAPTSVPPGLPTGSVTADGSAVVGTGTVGGTIIVTGAGGVVLGTVTVGPDGRFSAPLTPAQRNGEVLSLTEDYAGGGTSPAIPLTAPDITAPAAPTLTISADGTVATGTGEPGANVRVTDAGGALIGTAIVQSNGSWLAVLSAAQANGQTVSATQADAAGNGSAQVTAVAPDITPPAPATDLGVAPGGGTVTGQGEPGARVEVRDAGGALLGRGTVDAGGRFAVAIVPAQVTGATLDLTLADAAGNRSGVASVVAPFDIAASGNAATATIDLEAASAPVSLGNATYVALASLGAVNLQAQVLAVPAVTFTVAPGRSLAASFTYDALATIGVAGGYSVVVQRFDGTAWRPVEGGAGGGTLLSLGLLAGDLSAGATLAPGTYRAFVTFDGPAGVGLLGTLSVGGTLTDFTDVVRAVPGSVAGNVITDPGPDGTRDVVSPQTSVRSVTVNGVTTLITADGTIVAGAHGTLVIDRDGDYRYTPAADAGAIGRQDQFTYTLVDASDGELASAPLTITIGSPDVTGAPAAANDVAVAAVRYANPVDTVAPALDFSFGTPAAVLVPRTGSGSDSFTVAAATSADVTITAVRTGILSLLPDYTLVVRDAGGAVVASATQTSLAGLPLGTGASFTLNDLAPGSYTYTLSSTNVAGTSYSTSVYLGQTITRTSEWVVTGTDSASGNLVANDDPGGAFVLLRVEDGQGGFVEVGEAPVTVRGDHGTLTVGEAGDYVYRPDAALGYASHDLTDSFTYQLVQPGGALATATLTVTIDMPADGPLAAAPPAGARTLAVSADTDLSGDLSASHFAYAMFEGHGTPEMVLPGLVDPAAAATGPALQPEVSLDYLAPLPIGEDDRHMLSSI